MSLKNKFTILAGSVLIAGGLLTGAAFAATAGTGATPAEKAAAQTERLEQAVKDGKLTQDQADVLKRLAELRQSAMEKLQADSKAVVEQAVKDGKLTQEEADKLQTHKLQAHKLQGRGHMGPGRGAFIFKSPMTQEELKAKLDEAVKSGKMTQEQADKILSAKAQLDSGKFGGKRGGFGHGFFFKSEKSQQAPGN